MTAPVVGIVGDGQLGQMLFQAAIGMGFYPRVYGASEHSPCRFLADHTTGDLYDEASLVAFGQSCDIVTIEVEHISTSALAHLEAQGVHTFPRSDTLSLIADKSTQKQFFVQNNIPTAPFWHQEEQGAIYPAIAKTHTGGYDGNGVRTVTSWQQAHELFAGRAFFIEQKLTIQQEISVILARNAQGELVFYPLVSMQFAQGKHVLKYFSSPADVSAHVAKQAQTIARSIVESLDYVGIMAVEYILDDNNQLYVNEIAPRVHNSGHHTQFACLTSQFAQHWRAILGLPFGSGELLQPVAAMNILASDEQQYNPLWLHGAYQDPLVHMHLYHKKVAKQYRKMGHVIAFGTTIEDAHARLATVAKQLGTL